MLLEALGLVGEGSRAPPVRDTRPLPLSFEGPNVQSPPSQDLLDLSGNTATDGSLTLLSSGDPFVTTSSTEGSRSTLAYEPASSTVTARPVIPQVRVWLQTAAKYARFPEGF